MTDTTPLQPTYYVRHPDDSYSVADPQPVAKARPAPAQADKGAPLAKTVNPTFNMAVLGAFNSLMPPGGLTGIGHANVLKAIRAAISEYLSAAPAQGGVDAGELSRCVEQVLRCGEMWDDAPLNVKLALRELRAAQSVKVDAAGLPPLPDGDYCLPSDLRCRLYTYSLVHTIQAEAYALGKAAPSGAAGALPVGWLWKMHGWEVTASGKNRAITTHIDLSKPPASTEQSLDFISSERVYVLKQLAPVSVNDTDVRQSVIKCLRRAGYPGLAEYVESLPAPTTAATPTAGEAVGVVDPMPGASGFTMACFKAADVPVGTKLFTTAGTAALTVEEVRAAGGIVHRDGNVFFTNIDLLNKAINAKPAAALTEQARDQREHGEPDAHNHPGHHDGMTCERAAQVIADLSEALYPGSRARGAFFEQALKAARYDWLRHGDNDELVLQRGPCDPNYVYLPRNEKLDAMIDSHMQRIHAVHAVSADAAMQSPTSTAGGAV